ncbi:hypothetical protein QUF50_08970 [Thiotrichales bacterium HSG1]|nr:hypothetical protein [Thiotrichales bacterium HSG1]
MKKLVIVMLLAAALGGTKGYIDHQLHQELDKLIITNQISAEYSEISSSLLGQVIITDLHLQPYVKIDKIILSKAYQFYNKLPESMVLNLKGVQIAIDNSSQSTPMLISAFGYKPYYINLKELHNLGYSNIQTDIYLHAKLQNKKLSLSGEINANDWGKFNISAELNNVSKLTNNMDNIELVSFQLKYFANELVNKVVKHLAKRNKITPTQLRHDFINKLKRDIKQTDITGQVQQFIENPQVLIIDLEPNFPMNISTLQTLPLQKINLKITNQ